MVNFERQHAGDSARCFIGHEGWVGALALQTNFGIERYVAGVAGAYESVGGGTTDSASLARAADVIRAVSAGALSALSTGNLFGTLVPDVVGVPA